MRNMEKAINDYQKQFSGKFGSSINVSTNWYKR